LFQAQCEEWGGYPAIVDSAEEVAFLKTVVMDRSDGKLFVHNIS